MLELFQTEWCPGSRRIRQRLTELGLDYLNHQVPVEREQRTLLFGLTGSDTVPTLQLEDGSALVGEEAILAYLERHYDESEQADAHRAKAAKARRRYLEEECGCSPLLTHRPARRPSRVPRPSSASEPSSRRRGSGCCARSTCKRRCGRSLQSRASPT